MLLICIYVNPRMQSLYTGKKDYRFIGLKFPFSKISYRSSFAYSIRMFNMNGSFRFSLNSTNISVRGIKGTKAGNNKWN